MESYESMSVVERKRAEVNALSGIRGSQVMDVILGRIDTARKTVSVPLDEINWDVKRAHADGYQACLDDLRVWLVNRSTSHVDDEGFIVSAKTSLSERKRRKET